MTPAEWFKSLPLLGKAVVIVAGLVVIVLTSGITAKGMFIDSPFGAGPDGPTGLTGSGPAADVPAPARKAAPAPSLAQPARSLPARLAAPAPAATAAVPAQAPPAVPPPGGTGALVSAGAPAHLGFSGDGTNQFTVGSWSSWGGATATATGTVDYLNCVPDCARSTISRPYPAVVTFSGLTGGAYTLVTEQVLAGPMKTNSAGQLADGSLLNNETLISPTWPSRY